MRSIHKCADFVILDNPYLLNEVVELFTHYEVTVSGIEGSVDIHCEGNAGFIFQNCGDSSLINLHFEGCHADISSYLSPPGIGSSLSSNLSTVLLIQTHDVLILNCSFKSHAGSAILLVNVAGVISIAGSTFIGNASAVTSQHPRSGGIVMRQHPMIGYNNTVRVASCNFKWNLNSLPTLSGSNCARCGGAIDIDVASADILTSVLIVGSSFSQNYACRGGAIHFSLFGKNCHLEASIINSIFSNNEAFFSGGAIVFSFYESLIGYDSYVQGTLDSYGKLLVKDSNFIENHASWGGAFAAYSVFCKNCMNTMNISITDCELRNNTASESGFAIGLSGVFNPTETWRYVIVLTVSGNCTFHENTFNSSYGAIGAISVQNANIVFGKGITTIDSNIGTGLLLRSESQAKFYGEVVFKNNTGVMGGAILIQSGSSIYIGLSSKVSFVCNEAMVNGGAIYSDVDDYYCVIDFDPEIFLNTTNVYFKGAGTPPTRPAHAKPIKVAMED